MNSTRFIAMLSSGKVIVMSSVMLIYKAHQATDLGQCLSLSLSLSLTNHILSLTSKLPNIPFLQKSIGDIVTTL